MSATIAPKSDQINADDLIAGARTITITRVVGCPSPEQPVAMYFEGDDGKPYKPCKSMRRVLVSLWGSDASQYGGRSMRLYRDPDVQFGGMKVGGIRISHLSHIEREAVLALTATKASRKPFTVKPLAVEKPAQDKATQAATALIERIKAAPDMAALEKVTGDETVVRQRAWLAEKRSELAKLVDDAVRDALAALEAAGGDGSQDDGWPGPATSEAAA
jgi:hypothetical protein